MTQNDLLFPEIHPLLLRSLAEISLRIPWARVSCPMGSVVAIRRRKGKLLAMIRGWGRWYPVESVRIEGTGPQLLQEGLIPHPPGTVLAWSPWADQEASLPCPPSEAGGKYPTK